MRFRNGQNGFSMIEVLVAVLILSFGIASIGLMMLTTVQNARGAAFRSKAVAYTQDMAERIRANARGRDFYDTGTTSGADNGCFGASTTSCSPEELAEHDIHQWKQRLADAGAGLPNGSGTITQDTATTPSEFDIQVSWTNGSNENGVVTETFTLSTRP